MAARARSAGNGRGSGLWPLAALRPRDGNPRTHSDEQVALIARSIQEFGFTNPILAHPSGRIIAGHGRFIAAQRVGLTEVPVVVLPKLTEAQERALVIADNQIALNAGWDDGLLAAELAALEEGGFDLSLLGFTDDELARLLAEPEGEGDANAAPAKPATPTSRAGDLWVLGEHRLLCGDATNEADVERALGERQADLLFTDPPYGIGYESRSTTAGFQPIENDDLNLPALREFLGAAFQAAAAGLRHGAAAYVFHTDQKVGARHVFEGALLDAGFFVAGCIVWVKNAPSMGWQDYRGQHEPILYGWLKGGEHRALSTRSETTVWEIDRDAASEYAHPTQKPVELAARAIRNSTIAGETVLDVFGGSGSTLIAAGQHARRAVLVEKDPGYCDVIVQRWEAFTGKAAHLDGTDSTFGEVAADRAS